MHYRNHLEACYCIAGEVEYMQGNVFPIRPGDVYGLEQPDRHYLRGDERHNRNDSQGSAY
ncbi:ectoine synthase [Pseudomonas germanica]|uniref:ectoine synthase n=1 Tax=Pseudomonas germanica TaxID=2815720 RepID=UPI002A4E2AFB|nr:ectoine synthase [Pseudomonas germanica]WPN77298.1 ectoine synthase [Pseudomonas germanica]